MIRIVALKLYKLSYIGLANLGDVIIAGMTGNAFYTTPSPTLIAYGTALTALKDAITAWGPVGNRGKHQDLVNLRAKRNDFRILTTALAEYAENISLGDRTQLVTVGWPLRQLPHTIGRLEAVQDLHQFISREVDAGEIKLKWTKPLNAVNVRINGYRIIRSATSNPASAEFVGNSSKTSFIDTDPMNGVNYYWVIPFNSIDGVTSDLCAASVTIAS